MRRAAPGELERDAARPHRERPRLRGRRTLRQDDLVPLRGAHPVIAFAEQIGYLAESRGTGAELEAGFAVRLQRGNAGPLSE